MTDPFASLPRGQTIGLATLYCGDCLEIMPILSGVDHVISDPPYEAVMQNKWGVLSRNAPSSHVRHEEIGFDSIDEIRDEVAQAVSKGCQGWAVLFCMAEGVRAWRDALEAAGARYKRAMIRVGMAGDAPEYSPTTKNTQGAVHPTQKPLPLMRQLVHLFSNEGQTVLDPFMGSGTTGVAAVLEGRRFIGIERDAEHFASACKRIEDAQRQGSLFEAAA